ncbi:hypothetical protein [Spongiactinospora sp. 9N601]
MPFPVRPLESLTVTLFLARPTGPATFHMGATATSSAPVAITGPT